MKVLIVDTYYPAFLNAVYTQNVGLDQLPYQDQWRVLMNQCFGTADYYSANLRRLGHDATEIVANCEPLQRQWAKEQSIKVPGNQWTLYMRGGLVPWPRQVQRWIYAILAAQIIQYRPDVLHIQDMNLINSNFLRQIRPYVGLIVGQIAYAFTSRHDFSAYDLILSSLPHYVQLFRKQGLNSELFRLGFESTVLDKLVKLRTIYPVVHIGSYGTIHRERNQLLENLLQQDVPLMCWGTGVNYLPENSLIRKCYQGEAWGKDMYTIRHNSKIVVSKHIDRVAYTYANIMTLYEATGVGTLLIIDQRQDLHKLFKPGKEVIAFQSAGNCAELIQYYLEHEEERLAIAQAGQVRTLSEHTYYHRMQEFVTIIQPRL